MCGMSSEHSFEFTKEKTDLYLKEIAKEHWIRAETKKPHHFLEEELLRQSFLPEREMM